MEFWQSQCKRAKFYKSVKSSWKTELGKELPKLANMATSADQNEKEFLCCYKDCGVTGGRTLAAEDARVDVRAFESKSKQKVKVVDWQEGGAATFHRACWSELLKATKDSTSSISLSDVERSMILDAKKTAEYHDSKSSVLHEAKRIAYIIKNSRHCIVFTGAGISTAAGIGDFRGIDGKWTKRDKLKNYGSKGAGQAASQKPVEQLRPTYTHEALFKLMEMGVIKFVISQNTDGLHRLSGIPADQIAELHGNSFIEKCEECERRYERSFPCRKKSTAVPEKKCPRCRINHRTGRRCSQPGCQGFLMNTIINFGDYLEKDVIGGAQTQATMADCVLALGSTLMVSPANDLVLMGQQPIRLLICNRQTTPYDILCLLKGPDDQPVGSRVFGDCDILMKQVMSELLTPEELQSWEGGRKDRLVEYGLKRTTVR
ncbi:NAD-dependent deacetylase sirtuin-6 [Plakobranchus ocellatus]|uniref:NAD-dependent deacetylase sirtuin-6 n=1 Tax=Plakobranchus ocellatus TaxID=259542 RepID=A0AAV3YZ90_9GAST|nr:NAD-dependent deacetylase sirtuin-6 [Plakobranchus ocellatus]